MLRAIIILLSLFINLYALKPSVEEFSWPSGVSLSQFLETNNMPYSLYNGLDDEDKELATEIIAGVKCQILRDSAGGIAQILIPISEELQIHIFKDNKDRYKLEFAPISYQEESKVISINIERSVSEDLYDYTGSAWLTFSIQEMFKGQGVDFKRLKKGDRVALVYTQKIRMGKIFGTPEISAALVETRNKRYVMYKFEGRFYDKHGKKNDKFLLTRPILNARISSPFNPRRFHPILRKYRAHLGVDYAAPRGTPIRSAGDGLVKFVGVKGGYGNVVIIRHIGGYETLYAHLNGFAKGMRAGINVKQGTLIAYVGSSGMSTGPHLHFGLYQNNKAINPESVLKVVASSLSKKEMAKFKDIVSKNDELMREAMRDETPLKKIENFPNIVEL